MERVNEIKEEDRKEEKWVNESERAADNNVMEGKRLEKQQNIFTNNE